MPKLTHYISDYTDIVRIEILFDQVTNIVFFQENMCQDWYRYISGYDWDCMEWCDSITSTIPIPTNQLMGRLQDYLTNDDQTWHALSMTIFFQPTIPYITYSRDDEFVWYWETSREMTQRLVSSITPSNPSNIAGNLEQVLEHLEYYF
jgi:hypothetical protein